MYIVKAVTIRRLKNRYAYRETTPHDRVMRHCTDFIIAGRDSRRHPLRHVRHDATGTMINLMHATACNLARAIGAACSLRAKRASTRSEDPCPARTAATNKQPTGHGADESVPWPIF